MKLFFNVILFVFVVVNFAFGQSTVTTFRSYIQNKDYEKAAEIAQQVLTENSKDANLALEVGDVYYELENYSKALDAYSRAREINDDDNKIVVKVARALTVLNRGKEAIDLIEKPLKKDKKNVDLLIALANAHLSLNDIKNAELQITNARNYDDKNAAVYSMLGDIYYNQSIWELAKTNYEGALKYDSTNVLARQKLAETYWQLAVQANDGGDTELLNEYLNRSLSECNTLVQNDSKDANSWRLKGKIHYNAGQNLEAAQSYNKFLELRPNNFKERWRLAELFAQGNNPKEAIPHLVIISESNHVDISDSIKHKAVLYLGSCYYKTQDYTNAVTTLTKEDKRNPLEAIDLKLLALSYLFAKDTANSLLTFDRLLTLAPSDNCDVVLNVARIYNMRKQYSDVIKTINISINNNCPVDKNTPYLYYLLGTSNFELKNSDTSVAGQQTKINASIAALKKAIEINPEYYFAYIYLGDIYYFQKNVVEGEKQMHFVIDNAKSDVVTNASVLGMAYSKLCGNRLETKKYNDLIKITKEWLELIPEKNEYANLYLAIAYHGLQEKDNACRYYNEVLKINPENKTAKDNKKSLGC